MTTRDTKDGIADLLFEQLIVNKKVKFCLNNNFKCKINVVIFQKFEVDMLNVLKNLRKVNLNGVDIVSETQLIEIHQKIIQ